MSPETLLEHAQISDSNSPQYLQEECLVYLIRDYFKKGQDDIVNKLSNVLLRRSARFIYGKLQALDLGMVKDAYRDTINELWALIFNLESDQADFLQVRYWFALKRLTISTFRKYYALLKQAKTIVPLSALDDNDPDSDDRESGSVSWDDVSNPPVSMEQRLLFKEGLNILKEPYRTVFILYYYEDWPIESKDPSKMTISKHFKKTEKTIRNWLKEAREQLRRWRDENERS